MRELQRACACGLLLLACSGMATLSMAGDLVTVFLGIETMSIGVYVMTASRRRSGVAWRWCSSFLGWRAAR